jgi:hypothetical protein
MLEPRSAGAESDDPALRVVGRDPYGHSVARYNLDSKTAHAPAQLSQHFLARFDLDAIEATAVDGNYSSLHINQIVLTQAHSIINKCATGVGIEAIEAASEIFYGVFDLFGQGGVRVPLQP